MNHETADELIDATLTTVRTTPPPPDLEARLLHTLEAARQQVRVPLVSPLRHGWAGNNLFSRLWIPTGLAAGILAIIFASHGNRPAASTSLQTAAATQEAPSNSFRNKPVILSEAQRSRRTPKLPTDHSSPDLSASGPALTTATLYEQAALANTLAPSQPAPPLPLTQQERLLLRCTRRGQPIEVADLDLNQQGSYQAATEARERDLQRYIKGLLHTLVDFQPADPTPQPDETQPPPDPPAPTQQPTSRN